MTRELKMQSFCSLLIILGFWASFAGQWLGGIMLMLWAAWIVIDNMPVDRAD